MAMVATATPPTSRRPTPPNRSRTLRASDTTQRPLDAHSHDFLVGLEGLVPHRTGELERDGRLLDGHCGPGEIARLAARHGLRRRVRLVLQVDDARELVREHALEGHALRPHRS